MALDEELYTIHFKIRSWYLKELKAYRDTLPWHEFKLVKEALDKIMEDANKGHRTRHINLLRALENSIQSFIPPYEVTLWQTRSQNMF